MGTAKRYADRREPTQGETGVAVSELRAIAGDCPDPLAEVAVILLGGNEGELDELRPNAAVSLCIAAGADENWIPGWIEGVAAGSRSDASLIQRPGSIPATPQLTASRERERHPQVAVV